MSSHNSRVWTKVTALLLSLAALWGFAAWVTLRDGLDLRSVSTLDTQVHRPMVTLVTSLQAERRLSLVYLGNPGRETRAALATQRQQTDGSRAKFRESAGGDSARGAASDALAQRIDQALARLTQLDSARKTIDAGRVDLERAAGIYNDVIDAGFHVYESNAGLDDQTMAKDGRTLIQLARAREILSREDAMLAGALTAGRFTVGEQQQFVQLVGTQRFLHAEAAAELPPADRARYERFVNERAFTRFRFLEERIVQSGQAGTPLPVTAEEWQSVTKPVLSGLDGLVLAGDDKLAKRASSIASGVVLRLALAGGLGLIAVIASIILTITSVRALILQLERLALAARKLADERLPTVVERLGRGERVDLAAEAPPLLFGSDTIGQVGQAFNDMQKTAVRVAVEQAELRHSIRDILLSLARRTQSLVHRQLTLLDTMERRETDAVELKDLFRVDHLATRMRRNAENLIVLSGASPGRAWRRAVPMVDVVRGALAEVEDYTRVTLMPMGQVELAGRAVGDVIHLLAELVENAVSFSPPYTMVQVSGQTVANGHAIEIEDRGLGMSQEDLASANERIANPPDLNPGNTAQLGLFVVSRLAARHGIRVALKNSMYGGTTAVVLIPRDLIVEEAELEPVSGPRPPAPLAIDMAPAPPRDGEGMNVLGQGTARISLAGIQAVPEPRGDSRPTDIRPAVSRPPDTSPSGTQPPPDTGPTKREEDPWPVPDMEYTPSGLPLRVPQATLAPAMRGDGPLMDESPAGEDDRSPDDIRKVMGSFQAGTLRGRSDAEKIPTDDERLE